ncbi:uncharacterized protein [Malus domestica]|uniref:uncharacterized protein n=1 Tax=Malus domestica TaxID=3750 RepID=UPI0039759587
MERDYPANAKDNTIRLPKFLEYSSCMVHLVVFGSLQGWFFLDGVVGCCFRRRYILYVRLFAIGLSAGYIGSLTTFSCWKQKMLELSAEGHWVFALLGFLIAMPSMMFHFIESSWFQL